MWDAKILKAVGSVECAAAADIVTLADEGVIDLAAYPDLVALIESAIANYEDQIAELEDE